MGLAGTALLPSFISAIRGQSSTSPAAKDRHAPVQPGCSLGLGVPSLAWLTQSAWEEGKGPNPTSLTTTVPMDCQLCVTRRGGKARSWPPGSKERQPQLGIFQPSAEPSNPSISPTLCFHYSSRLVGQKKVNRGDPPSS